MTQLMIFLVTIIFPDLKAKLNTVQLHNFNISDTLRLFNQNDSFFKLGNKWNQKCNFQYVFQVIVLEFMERLCNSTVLILIFREHSHLEHYPFYSRQQVLEYALFQTTFHLLQSTEQVF